MLLLVFLLHNAVASDYQRDLKYSMKRVVSCPEVGYFFKRDLPQNKVEPGLCHLCFCKSDGTAVCWQRNNLQCNVKNHNNIGKRDGRFRRSPVGFADVPPKDAARNFFRKESPYKCKLLGSSFSEDCPPNDWCLGCTVCDCDVSGHWSCHVLRFCTEKKAPKHIENQNNALRRRAVKINSKSFNRTNSAKVLKSAKKVNTNTNNGVKSHNRFDFFNAKLNSVLVNRKPLPKHDDKMVVIEKDLVARKPTEVQGVRVKKILNENNPNVKLAHKVMQRVMAAAQKIINMNERNFGNATKVIKVIQKRSMSKHDDISGKFLKNQTEHAISQMYKKSSPRKYRKKISMNKNVAEYNTATGNKRIRRNILNQGNSSQTIQTTTDFYNNFVSKITQNTVATISPIELNKNGYYKYNVVTDRNKLDAKGFFINNELEVKPLNCTFKNKYVLKNQSQNIWTNKILDSNKSNFTMWQQLVTNETEKFTTTENETGFKYTNVAQTINPTFKFDRHHLHKTHKNMVSSQVNVMKEEKREHNETEDLHFITNMVNGDGFSEDVLKQNSHRNTSKHKSERHFFNLTPYLKRLFSKTLTKKKNGATLVVEDNKQKLLSKQNILDTFCIKHLLCKVHPRDEIRLQIKINDLNGEIYKIIKTIKIIKKLLQLLIKSKNESINKNFNSNFIDDIRTVRGSFSNNRIIENVIENHQLQRYCIKDSIKLVIKSIGKFSNILQDILNILTINDAKRSTHRPLRCTKKKVMSKINSKTATDEQNYKKLKMILVNYNLLQNTFVKRIYEILTTMESNLNRTEMKRQFKKPDEAYRRDSNRTFSIETNTKIIIENLRKLKNLAQKLTATHRRKREAMRDDDAVEYLLMLMEYLLKQNYPLDVAPVNDGIDLLIDAIKHAPDIKPIKKKVLDTPTTKTTITRTTERVTAATFSYVDNIYGIDSLEKENNDTSNFEDNQIIFSPKPVDDRNYKEEKFRKLLHGHKNINKGFKFNNFNGIDKNIELDFMSSSPTPSVTITPLIRYDFFKDHLPESSGADITVKKDHHVLVYEKDKNENDGAKSAVNLEILHTGIEDNAVTLDLVITESDTESPVTFPTRTIPVEKTTTRKFHHMPREKFESTEILTDERNNAKSKFDWVDYDHDDGGGKLIQRKTTPKITKAARKKHMELNKNDISSLTKEIIDDDKKKRFDIISPKELNLANSLEYGIIRSEIDTSDSKDGEPEDTYVNEIFPSYFA